MSGAELYRYGGRTYRPSRDRGPAPECRIEISPSKPAKTDFFLHVLTATDAGTLSVPRPVMELKGASIAVAVKGARVTFLVERVGGFIEFGGKRLAFADRVYRGKPPRPGEVATKPKRSSPAKDPPKTTAPTPEEPKTDPKAAELYRWARQAEGAGMRGLAKTLYERLLKEFPDDPLTEKARKRLKE